MSAPAHRPRDVGKIAAFAAAGLAALHFADRVLAGLVQCSAWASCPPGIGL